jgi:alpha-tubulin suppressor-like RCC1 family protein
MPSSSKKKSASQAIGFGANYSLNFGPAKPTTFDCDNDDDEDDDNVDESVEGYTLDANQTPWGDDDGVAQIATTATSTFFLTKNSGTIYTCGTLHGRVLPQLTRTIIQLPLKCVEVAAGRHFGLARMEGGLAVCSWGAGHFGQLGLGGNSAPCVEHPTVIESLLPHVVGAPISGIAAGYWHAMAVTQAGHVWSWGCNRNAQCGIKPNKDPPTVCAPQLVRFESSGSSSSSETETAQIPKIRTIAAGRSHSAALDENGAVYCWGACQYGQCGILSRRRGGVAPPKHVDSLAQVQIVDISAGDSHTLALTGGGRVFGWGSGFEGQLGTGSIVQMNPKPKLVGDLDFVAIEAGREWKTQQKQKQQFKYDCEHESEYAPEPVRLEASPDPSAVAHALSQVPKIVSVLATGNCSIATSSSGHVYAWGCNDVGNLGVPKPDPGTLTFAEPGLPLPKTSTLRQFHTYSFDSSHNVALPQRLECLRHMNITSVAASPTFLWCLGTKRTEEENEKVVGRTLYEIQEEKRQKSLRPHRKERKLDSSAASKGAKMSTSTSEQQQQQQQQAEEEASQSPKAMDPPEMVDGSEVDEAEGDFGEFSNGEEGSTSKHSAGRTSSVSDLERNTTQKAPKSLPTRSPTLELTPKSKRRFSIPRVIGSTIPKAFGKIVRRASHNGGPFRSDNAGGGDNEKKVRKGFF